MKTTGQGPSYQLCKRYSFSCFDMQVKKILYFHNLFTPGSIAGLRCWSAFWLPGSSNFPISQKGSVVLLSTRILSKQGVNSELMLSVDSMEGWMSRSITKIGPPSHHWIEYISAAVSEACTTFYILPFLPPTHLIFLSLGSISIVLYHKRWDFKSQY